MAPRDYNELTGLIQTLVNPLIQKLSGLEEKVDRLGQDRATRSDIESLRKELVGIFVPRDAYEPHRTALIERDLSIETMVRELRKDVSEDLKTLQADMSQDLQRMDTQLKQQADVQLSSKDRYWLRVSQWVGFLGIGVAVLDWLSQHWK